MTKINELKMTIDSRSINECFSRVAVASFSSQLDMTVEELGDIKTVDDNITALKIYICSKARNLFIYNIDKVV